MRNENVADVIDMLARIRPDYDADGQRPDYDKYKAGVGKRVKDDTKPYPRKLEEIDESWVKAYLIQALVGLKKDKCGGLREYRTTNRESTVFVDDNGDEVEESELAVEEQEYSPLTIAEAKSKLPYLLKRLHDKSKQIGVSVISLISVYERAKVSTAGKAVRPSDMLAYNVYRMDSHGNITSPFPESANSAKQFPNAFAWINGSNRDKYFYDAMELLSVCDILGIDIKNENPMDFQEEDIQNMQVTYITRNRDYMRGAKGYNLEVLDCITKVSITDYSTQEAKEKDINFYVQDTIQAVLDCISLTDMLGAANIRRINLFFEQYASVAPDFKIKGRTPTVDDFYIKDGFLYASRILYAPQLFRLRKYVGASEQVLGIMHISGVLFIVTHTNTLMYQDAETVAMYIRDGVAGEWDTCFS